MGKKTSTQWILMLKIKNEKEYNTKVCNVTILHVEGKYEAQL